jgi:hypothetical protein
VIRYTADKKGYIFDQESKYYTGMDKDDFDDWAKSRAKLAVEKWDAILEANAKEHATLSAGASVERGVGVEATQEHENRAADRGCVSRLVVPSSFVLRGHADEIGNLSLQFMQDLFLSPRMDKYLRTQEGETLREMFPRGLDLVMDRQELRQTTAMPSRAMSQNQEQSSEQRNPDKPNPCG